MKELEISGIKYSLFCNIVNEQAECILCNDKEFWSARCSWEQVLHQVKQLNKRVLYKDDVVRDTLQQATPAQSVWMDTGDKEDKVLKLKYSIGKPPFTFQWQFSRQSERDLQKFMLSKVSSVLNDLTQQVEDLSKAVRAKDVEIKQYKSEGAVLDRKTLATKPYNFSNFNAKYAETNSATLYLQQIAKHLQAREQSSFEVVASVSAAEKVERNAEKMQEETQLVPKQQRVEKELPAAIAQKLKGSPRNNKRKAREIQEQHVQQRLNARKQKLQYQSSQSQSLSEEFEPAADEAAVTEDQKTDIAKNIEASPASTPREKIAPKRKKSETNSHERNITAHQLSSTGGTRVLRGRRIEFEGNHIKANSKESEAKTPAKSTIEAIKSKTLLELDTANGTEPKKEMVANGHKITEAAAVNQVQSLSPTNVFDIHSDINYILSELKSCDERLSAYRVGGKDL